LIGAYPLVAYVVMLPAGRTDPLAKLEIEAFKGEIPVRRRLSVTRSTHPMTLQNGCPGGVDIGHQLVGFLIAAVGVIAFGEAEVSGGEFLRRDRSDIDPEPLEECECVGKEQSNPARGWQMCGLQKFQSRGLSLTGSNAAHRLSNLTKRATDELWLLKYNDKRSNARDFRFPRARRQAGCTEPLTQRGEGVKLYCDFAMT
jgi:hypothetical protein